MKTLPLPLAMIAFLGLAAGCSERTASPTTADDRVPVEDPPAHGDIDTGGAAAAPAAPAGLQGAVLETMDAGGYTYALLDTGSEEVWVAAPVVQLTVGEDVRAVGSMEMLDFHSPSLDRTFDVLYFAQQIARSGEATGGGLPAGHGTPQMPDPRATADLEGIDRAEGGRTVEEVFLMKAELVGTSIAIRGRVVKYNGGILGKNWLHLRDGTGEAGTNDLTITTDATCAVGDTVLVNGKLVADRDFGSGYVYDLIVEDAEVTVE